jgi:nickel transport protein
VQLLHFLLPADLKKRPLIHSEREPTVKTRFYFRTAHPLPVLLAGFILTAVITAGFCERAQAHTVNYQVENRGISIRVFYEPEDPASYSSYEIFGPGDKITYQKGRTDKNGFVSFLPDRKGIWIIKVYGESEHGIHGAQIKVKVNENLSLESFKKPLVAKYTKAFVGISFILAIFGSWSLVRSSKGPRTNK